MRSALAVLLAIVAAAFPAPASAAEAAPASAPWRIIIVHDTCPDVTWGFTEAQVRRSFADLIRAHLDEMNRTDDGPAEKRNHYSLVAFIEADAVEQTTPFLPKLCGCFGHSWELWPVSLAQAMAAAGENERAFLAAESPVALASQAKPELPARTRADRLRHGPGARDSFPEPATPARATVHREL
jgi:hypothetical protein